MQFQVELPHSFRKFRPELTGIRFVPKSNHDVICKSHDYDVTVRPLLSPCLDPQVEQVMKIDVGQQRRSYFSNAKDNFSFDRVLRYR